MVASFAQGMKQKLESLEGSLAIKLEKARQASEWTTLRPAGGLSGRRVGGAEERTDPEDEDARSDMSALPEDVIDAIENPHLSDSDAEVTKVRQHDSSFEMDEDEEDDGVEERGDDGS